MSQESTYSSTIGRSRVLRSCTFERVSPDVHETTINEARRLHQKRCMIFSKPAGEIGSRAFESHHGYHKLQILGWIPETSSDVSHPSTYTRTICDQGNLGGMMSYVFPAKGAAGSWFALSGAPSRDHPFLVGGMNKAMQVIVFMLYASATCASTN